MYSNNNREPLEKLEKLVSLQSQVESLSLQNKLGKQIFHKDLKKVLEAIPKTFKDVSEAL